MVNQYLWEEWSKIWHIAVPDHLWNWLYFGRVLLIFLILVAFWHSETSPVCGIVLRTHGRSWLKFGMLIYPDHLQNWLDFVHGLLIFLIFSCPLCGSVRVWLPLRGQGTLGNPFAHPGKKHNAPLLLFTWKIFILTDLTNIYLPESISSRI